MRAFRRCSTLRAPSTLVAAKPSGAHQHAHPAPSHPGGSAACAAPMPACFGAVAGKVWPAMRVVRKAAVATSRFCEPCFRGAV